MKNIFEKSLIKKLKLSVSKIKIKNKIIEINKISSGINGPVINENGKKIIKYSSICFFFKKFIL
tara:strand:+ start:112 stop:303 length:192 start_codon:yes stop_codon:yes gene_type:complete